MFPDAKLPGLVVTLNDSDPNDRQIATSGAELRIRKQETANVFADSGPLLLAYLGTLLYSYGF